MGESAKGQAAFDLTPVFGTAVSISVFAEEHAETFELLTTPGAF